MRNLAAVALVWLCLSSTAAAQGPFRTEQVRFAKGASSATVAGSIRADGGVSYVLVVRAGQMLKVSMRTANASARFNVIAPGLDEPLFNGSGARGYAAGTPVAGAYKIIVYLTEDAAARNETADYVLTIGVTR